MIAIITSSTGYEHALAEGQRVRDAPQDENGKRTMDTICGKRVTGRTGAVAMPQMIRCRPCKGAIAKGKRYTRAATP